MSLIALFAALCGGTYAAGKLGANSVGSKQVKDESLGGRDVNEAKLGEVPAAASAREAGLLDGIDSAALARRGSLQWESIDEAHQASSPPGQFTCFHSDGVSCDQYFENFDGPGAGRASAAFARDESGIVHLQGSVRFVSALPGTVNPGALFDLPAGFRPPDLRVFAALENGTDLNRLDVAADGAMALDQGYEHGDWFSLDGISFPCGPSGADGCP